MAYTRMAYGVMATIIVACMVAADVSVDTYVVMAHAVMADVSLDTYVVMAHAIMANVSAEASNRAVISPSSLFSLGGAASCSTGV